MSKDPETWKRRAGQQLAWMLLDEAEGNMNLLNELYPRLLDANKDPEIVAQAGGGWLLWGATPTTANVALMNAKVEVAGLNGQIADLEVELGLASVGKA